MTDFGLETIRLKISKGDNLISPLVGSDTMINLGLGLLSSTVLYGRGGFSPASLFSSGEQGAWYDPSDFTTMFQDAAGTTPVTAVEQPVGLIRDKSGRGNHASQSTAASRPVLSSRVNLLTYTEQFDNAAWLKTNTTVSANTSETTDPLGGNTAEKISETTTNGIHWVYQGCDAITASVSHTVSVCVKGNGRDWCVVSIYDGATDLGRYFQLTGNGTVGGRYGSLGSVVGAVTPLGNGWYRCTITTTTTAAGAFRNAAISPATADGTNSYAGDVTKGMYLWGADLRPANAGVGLPSYQRVGAATDYDTTGFPLYLKFDGTDDVLTTANIDFSSTDKVSVFAGLRKLSDASFGIPVGFGGAIESGGVNGGFNITTRNAPGYGFASKGTVFAEATIATGYAAPISNVLTGLGDIAGDKATLRINGTQVAQTTTDQGTGTYLTWPLTVGSRAASSVQFNGHLYSLIVRGALSTDAQIASTETYVNNLTKAY